MNVADIFDLLQTVGDLRDKELSQFLALDLCETLLSTLSSFLDLDTPDLTLEQWLTTILDPGVTAVFLDKLCKLSPRFFDRTCSSYAKKVRQFELAIAQLRRRLDIVFEAPSRRDRTRFRHLGREYKLPRLQRDLLCYLQRNGESGEDELIDHLWNRDDPNDPLLPMPRTRGRLRKLQSMTNMNLLKKKVPLEIIRPDPGYLLLRATKKSAKR